MAAEKNIAILVEHDYRDHEVWYRYYRVHAAVMRR
jgi:hypothetical protein